MRLRRIDAWVVVVLALPFVIALVNPSWLGNGVGDVDLWLYNGYLKALRAFAANRPEWGPAEYYEARLPIIVPGAIVHGLLPDKAARYVFNVLILHGTVALSLWHILRVHVSKLAATGTAILLTTDIFYLRTIGWDYIDNGVLAYQALTFALLTSGSGNLSRARMIGAGFSAMGMVTVNIGAVMWLGLLAPYALLVPQRFTSLRDLVQRSGRLLLWTGAGAVGCLVLFGTISAVLLNGPFAYWLDQVRGLRHVSAAEYAVPLGQIVISSHHATVHAAALAGAVVALALGRWRGTSSRFARFCLVATVVLYGLVTVGQWLKLSALLSRDGLYTSHFLVFTYLTVGVLLFDAARAKPWVLFVFLGACVPSVVAKLCLHDGYGLISTRWIPMYWLALALSVASLVAFLVRNSAAIAIVPVAFGVAGLLMPWRFVQDDAIIDIRNYVLTTTRPPPRIFYSEADPQRLWFVSVAAALTDHVVHDVYQFPRAAVRHGDRVVVLNSQASAGASVPPCEIEGLRPTGSRLFPHAYRDIVVHTFEALREGLEHDTIACRPEPPPPLAPWKEFKVAELANPTTGEMHGESRVAIAPESPAGWIGQVASFPLEAGTYELTFYYSAINRPGIPSRYEIVDIDYPGYRFVGAAAFEDTEGKPATQSVRFTTGPMKLFGAQIYFTGFGELTLSRVTLSRAPPP